MYCNYDRFVCVCVCYMFLIYFIKYDDILCSVLHFSVSFLHNLKLKLSLCHAYLFMAWMCKRVTESEYNGRAVEECIRVHRNK